MKKIEGGICAVPGIRAAGAREGKYGVAVIAGSGVASGASPRIRLKLPPWTSPQTTSWAGAWMGS